MIFDILAIVDWIWIGFEGFSLSRCQAYLVGGWVLEPCLKAPLVGVLFLMICDISSIVVRFGWRLRV